MILVFAYLAGCCVAFGFLEVAMEHHPEVKSFYKPGALFIAWWPIALFVFIGFSLGRLYYREW